MCKSCYDKEISLQAQNNTPEKQQERIDLANNRMNVALQSAREVDARILVRPDIFNAATVAIVELKQIIDSDGSIENKNFKLAEVLLERFEHFKTVIFEANETVVQATNNQKAIQIYLNQLANQLRAEEREKLKIQDINYKPKEVKPVKPRAIKTAKPKLDKAALRKYAAELGISEFMLQTIVVSRGVSVEQAADILRKSIKESISESQPVPDNEEPVDMDSNDFIVSED
jgi:hypothetical protein